MLKETLAKELNERAEKAIAKVKRTAAEARRFLKESDEEIHLLEPYTSANAPDWVKKLPVEARDGWIKAFNAAHRQYKDEGKAFAVANSALGKMGYKKKDDKWIKEAVRYSNVNNSSSPKEIIKELMSDIKLFLAKAESTIRGKIGSPAIRSFLREVKMKLSGMVSKLKETELTEEAKKIVGMIELLESQDDKLRIETQEAAPLGTFERLQGEIEDALKKAKVFKVDKEEGYYPYVRYMYIDRIIVSFKSKLFSVDYDIGDKKIKFGKPKEVKEETFIKESDVVREGTVKDEENLEVADFISLKEAKFDAKTGEVEVILIEAGTNPRKKRHYPSSTIREAASGFKGLKMYIDHPTVSQERERPERSVKDWASTIVESNYSDGKAIGKVAVHDKWLIERLNDPVARAHIGLSINTGGRVSYGKVKGVQMQIVEKIVFNRKSGPASVDWVTEPGARGRVSKLLESRREELTMLENITLEDLKKERSDLVESIRNEKVTAEDTKKKEAELKEANEKIASFEKEKKSRDQEVVVQSVLKESKAPEAIKSRVEKQFKDKLFEKESDLKEAIAKSLKEELEYASQISGKGTINLGEGSPSGGASLVESLTGELEKRAGIKKEKKEDE